MQTVRHYKLFYKNESKITMQKRMQTCKTQKQRRRILRRMWENERRNKIMDQRNRRMETKSDWQIESYMMEWFWIALSLYPIWVIINLITPRLGLPCLWGLAFTIRFGWKKIKKKLDNELSKWYYYNITLGDIIWILKKRKS